MTKAQQYINKEYPKKGRQQIKKIDIGNKELEGKLTLELNQFPNLEELDCSNNLLTGITFTNPHKRITRSSSGNKEPKLKWKIRKLNLANNNFAEQNLSFLEELTELEELSIANNKIIGSLDSLKSMTKLKRLDISDTDIDSGLEYLPENLEEINCSFEINKNAKVQNIIQKLNDYRVNKNEENNWWKIDLKELQKETSKTLLISAVKKNEIEEVKGAITKLEKLGVNVTHIINSFRDGKYKLSSLHIAAARNYYEMAKLLLEIGADPNIQDSKGNTPLHFAAEKNNLELLKLLAKNEGLGGRGDINAVNIYNWSILHSAASGIINEKEDWEIIKWLLKNGADTNVTSKAGSFIRDVFFDKDWSYAEIYDKLVRESESNNKIIYFQQRQK